MEALLKNGGRKISVSRGIRFVSLYDLYALTAKEDTNMCKALSVEKRIAVALWRLATGDTYRSTSLQFDVGRSTALKAKKEFYKILAKKAVEFIKFPITEAEAAAKICSFTDKSSFPQVVGAINGTHIPLKSVPQRERVEYFNRKQDYCLVLQGVADASFRFLDVSTGYPGSIHDARILRMSRLHRSSVIIRRALYHGNSVYPFI